MESEWRPSHLKKEILSALAAAVLASVLGVWALQLWKANLQVPFQIGSDSFFNLIMIKDVITHGWDLTNPSLGAPFGEELYDFPAFSGDSLYLVMIKALGLFSDNPGVVVNVFFLLCFPLIAIAAYGVLRRLGISIGVAIVCAVLYALLPYRLGSFEFHLFLSSYFIVPICCYLILAVFSGNELFVRDPRRSGLRAYATKRVAGMIVVCLVIGSADNYFALFTVALAVPAGALAFLANRRPRALACALAAATIIAAAVALNALPTIIYHVRHGPDNVPTRRLPQEADVWSLTLANLVLPVEDSRIPWLASLTHRYDTTVQVPASSPPLSEPAWTNLGIVGTLGLVWLSIALVIHCLSAGRGKPIDPREIRAALGAGLAFLIGTVGGLATLFAYIVSPQLHAPVRIVVFIAFFAVFGAALGMDRLLGRIGRGRSGRGVSIALLVGVLAIGVLYQTSPGMALNYRAEIEEYNMRKQFVRAIEAQVPAGSSIFQLPYVPFPQGAYPPGIHEYENLYVYLVSNDLRWSGGAMEGRPTDWVPTFLHRPLAQILEGVSAVGFQGLYVEPAGIAEANAVLRSLSNALGVAPLISPDGRLVFFDMAGYNRRLRERDSPAQIATIATAALHPTVE
ncbi:MAG TPA: hypothetical protein VN892_07975 [Solirubrobacteraceae bacterium]|nr:hypothetical protein [Solirubrobacteraceae bacterium]